MNEEKLKEIVREAVREEMVRWKRAEARGALAGFLIHLILYILVNLVCSIYVLAKHEYFWPIYPIIFWGAGLLIHLAGVLRQRSAALKE